MKDLVAASLRAILQAEAQAADATIEYIEEVGFEGRNGDRGKLGRLRMVEFSHTRMGPDGKPQEVRTATPLLSLMPIPSVAVKRATLDFGVDVARLQSAPSRDKRSNELHVFGTIAPTNGSERPPGDIRITMEVGPGDLPNGVNRLFHTMDNAIVEKATPTGKEAPTRRAPSAETASIKQAKRRGGDR